jgi:cellulose synthase/poly-beta-1,6-N-acetylglucosamine synthase-like glycosyltransferase
MTRNYWVFLHFSAIFGLALYGLHRIWLLSQWYREKRLAAAEPARREDGFLWSDAPFVTVQLPLYNERFVAARLLDAAAAIEWPGDRLEIQVLDDSTDDTSLIVDERAAFWSQKDIHMEVIRRSRRQGYKAGALRHGMEVAKGEFIAVFDADFIPSPDFLKRIMPCFADEKIGMAQAKWGFLNADHSWLTSIQSLLLGPHFSIEHWVRYRKNLFFNFNGTAGVWRRKAIEAAGGWEADTVTEDLDLSYRAQMAGWRFRYLDDLEVPSELPVTMSSFRCQQERWAKGSMQTARKILPRLLNARLPLSVKLEAMAHLLANFGWLLGAVITLTLYPTILARTGVGPHQLLRIDLPLFIFSSMAILLYFALYRQGQGRRVRFRALLLLPVFSIGLAPSIALSVFKGLFSKGGVFDRTPKYAVKGRQKLPALAFLYRERPLSHLIINTFFLAYTLLPIWYALERHTWFAVPFLLVFPFGFLLVIYMDLTEFLAAREPGTM